MADIGWNADIWPDAEGWYCRDCGPRTAEPSLQRSPPRGNTSVIPMSAARAHTKRCVERAGAHSAAALTSHLTRLIATIQQIRGI